MCNRTRKSIDAPAVPQAFASAGITRAALMCQVIAHFSFRFSFSLVTTNGETPSSYFQGASHLTKLKLSLICPMSKSNHIWREKAMAQNCWRYCHTLGPCPLRSENIASHSLVIGRAPSCAWESANFSPARKTILGKEGRYEKRRKND